MIIKGKRIQSSPILMDGENKFSTLHRVHFTEKIFRESWLQEIIDNYPSILPLDEIEPVFGNSISIGREIKTNVGYIDNLFINSDGFLTLVETKLWRNLQARREVLGQIIDYAKELTKWTYTDLSNAVRQSTSAELIDLIKQSNEGIDIDEKLFIDTVSRNLQRGRFLLLIVGDGIHESVEEMAEYLQQFAQINFTLALIELQVYKNTIDNSTLILPQIISRTKEITRAIIRIENNSTENININVQANLDEIKNDKVQIKNTLSLEDFFQQFEQNTNSEMIHFVKQVITDSESKGMLVEVGQSSLIFKVLDPNGNNDKISIFVIDRKNFFYLWFIGNKLNRRGYNPQIGNEFAEKTAKLFNLKVVYTDAIKCNWSKYLRVQDLKAHYDEFMKYLDELLQRISKDANAVNQ